MPSAHANGHDEIFNRRTGSADRLAPYSAEAERGILSCLLIGADFAEISNSGLSPAWFYDLADRKVFEAIRMIAQQGAAPDLLSVTAILAKDKEFPRALTFVSNLLDEATSTANWPYWVDILRENAQRRAVIKAATYLNEFASDQTRDPAAILADAEFALDTVRKSTDAGKLPEIELVSDLIDDQTITMPEELIAGIIHRGSKLILGGASKSYKTWALLDLAVSVATGSPWIGFGTRSGKVLYINLEIQREFVRRRIADIIASKQVSLNGNFEIWNLRGYAADYRSLLPKIRDRIKDAGHSLLVIDPTYKLLGAADENSATDISALLNSIEKLSATTKAAVAMAGHFAKGNAAGKEAMDRISGSGVFARDPDTLLVFTKHEEPEAFAVEMILRNLSPKEPFVVQWRYPLFERDCDLDPANLKRQPGRTKQYDVRLLLEVIAHHGPDNPISISAWAEAAQIARTTLLGYLEEMRIKGWITTIGHGYGARQAITSAGLKAISED